ncbi:MAG: RNA polymerase sigma factor [Solirubrobacteraceae bacterium]
MPVTPHATAAPALAPEQAATVPSMTQPRPHLLDPHRLGDHLDRLYRAAWGLCGSREDAEDLVQETYARVLKRPRVLRSEDDLGYLLRVLRNTFYSSHRAAKRRVRADALPDDLDRIEDRGAPHPERELEARELYALIAELPENFRDALVAIDLVGLSYREAARTLKVPEATITTRLYRARLRLTEAWRDPEEPANGGQGR